MTREEIAAGPKFEPFEEHLGCVACGRTDGTWTEVDRETGLGRCCWSAWRFSPACEAWRSGQEAKAAWLALHERPASVEP